MVWGWSIRLYQRRYGLAVGECIVEMYLDRVRHLADIIVKDAEKVMVLLDGAEQINESAGTVARFIPIMERSIKEC